MHKCTFLKTKITLWDASVLIKLALLPILSSLELVCYLQFDLIRLLSAQGNHSLLSATNLLFKLITFLLRYINILSNLSSVVNDFQKIYQKVICFISHKNNNFCTNQKQKKKANFFSCFLKNIWLIKLKIKILYCNVLNCHHHRLIHAQI